MPGTRVTISGMTINTDTLIDCPARPLTLGPVRRGPVQQPRPTPWFRYEGGTTSRRMTVYCRLPVEDPHHRLQRSTAWSGPAVWEWDWEN